ncbi:hypothetical protein ABZS29_21025 [Kribbella sp. NPDC005582]|uniref:hypothetical protein n=1 Tax=Kribbella sp. NPDC005582 TaxID=3156893 RepID=UPI0033A01A2F
MTLAGAVALGTAVLAPTSAQAAELIANRSTTKAPSDDNDGAARMTTYLRYTGASTITLRDTNVIDYCRATSSGPKGDGEGAYVFLRIQFRDGTRTDRAVVADTNGCDNGVIHRASFSATTTKRIDRVWVMLQERDGAGGSVDGITAGELAGGGTAYFDNPYT